MKEFEELEGLTDQANEEVVIEENDEDDASFRPANASSLSTSDVQYEVMLKHDLYYLTIYY